MKRQKWQSLQPTPLSFSERRLHRQLAKQLARLQIEKRADKVEREVYEHELVKQKRWLALKRAACEQRRLVLSERQANELLDEGAEIRVGLEKCQVRRVSFEYLEYYFATSRIRIKRNGVYYRVKRERRL